MSISNYNYNMSISNYKWDKDKWIASNWTIEEILETALVESEADGHSFTSDTRVSVIPISSDKFTVTFGDYTNGAVVYTIDMTNIRKGRSICLKGLSMSLFGAE